MAADGRGAWDDERALVAACRAGDEQAWAALYQAHAPRVARFLRRAWGRDADVEDLVQQVFVECLANLGRFRGDAPIAAWLYGVAVNVLGKARRAAFRRRRRADAFEAHSAVVAAPAAASAEGRASAREVFATVEEALGTLEQAQRVAWVLVELEGLTSEEAARALGDRPSTVRTRLQVARERVRRALACRERAAAAPAPAPRPSGKEVVTP